MYQVAKISVETRKIDFLSFHPLKNRFSFSEPGLSGYL